MSLKLHWWLQCADTQLFLFCQHISRSLVSLFSEKLPPFQSALWGSACQISQRFLQRALLLSLTMIPSSPGADKG